MAHNHEEQVPIALANLVARLDDLQLALGQQIAPVLASVREMLIAALAARDRGDVPGAIERIGNAMDRLTVLADQLDPAEAMLMRALAHNIRTALLRGDEAQAKHSAAVMLQKSGAVEGKKS